MNRKALTLQQDGINIESGLFVNRPVLIDKIIQTALESQHVVLSSPPATGKTSLLDMIVDRLEKQNERIFYFVPERNGEVMKEQIRSWGIPTSDLLALRKIDTTWILVDDAQRGYYEHFDSLWEFLIKDLKKNTKIKVIIASTHDMTSLGSPASIRLLPHVFENFSLDQVTKLINAFCQNFQIPDTEIWEEYWAMIMEMSMLETVEMGKTQSFHVEVLLRCLLELEKARKIPNATFNGETAQKQLRNSTFIQGFDRCFAVDSNMIQDPQFRSSLTDVLLGLNQGVVPLRLQVLVRAGVLTTKGTFSCQAANWFYNQIHFPHRAQDLPATLPDLVVNAVALLSASRLKACVQDDIFPLETSFQHLLNETMTCLLPIDASVKPEYRTKARGFLGDTKRGFIDFYVNDNIQWAVELLRLGHGLKEHRNRFHPVTGKYRALPTKKHLVVDIRGPKQTVSVAPRSDLCVLYFAEDWSTCSIQMETAADDQLVTLQL